MVWKLTIEKVNNGFYCYSGYDDTGEGETKFVIEQSEDAVDEVDMAKSLLYSILEYFSLRGSKHDKRRVKIDVEEHDF